MKLVCIFLGPDHHGFDDNPDGDNLPADLGPWDLIESMTICAGIEKDGSFVIKK